MVQGTHPTQRQETGGSKEHMALTAKSRRCGDAAKMYVTEQPAETTLARMPISEVSPFVLVLYFLWLHSILCSFRSFWWRELTFSEMLT
jgi:hypothetical protein